MIKVGLTGGIGSGKSMVATILDHLAVPVYHADAEAKKILEKETVKAQLKLIFGAEILDARGIVNRKALSDRVFKNDTELAKLNGLIHPLVRIDFESWCWLHAESSYIIQEAAILFESGFNVYFDKTIFVMAPVELCIERVVARDKIKSVQVLQRMNNQWEAERKIVLADYILVNDGNSMLLPQVLALHAKLKQLSETI